MQLKQRKRIDISDDPLFFNDEPVLKLRKLKLKKLADLETFLHQQNQRRETFDQNLHNNNLKLQHQKNQSHDGGKIIDYVKVQNRELNQVRLQQKFLNRSRILQDEPQKSKEKELPFVEEYLCRRTLNNIIKKSHLKHDTIKASLQKVETFLYSIDTTRDQFVQISPHTQSKNTQIKTTRNEEYSSHSIKSQLFNVSESPTGRDRSKSLKQTIEQNHEIRNLRSDKVKEIIYKTEEIRERSMAAKLSVYSEKPDSIQPTKKQLQQLRYKWVRKLKYKIELHNNQMKQFTEFLDYLKYSDDIVTNEDHKYLKYYRDKLLNGDHLVDHDFQMMINDQKTIKIGELIRKCVAIEN
ncbi:unnamed protein product (macronuclear) [Paramecium tetraurelia]|uniref:Uncharacterized protein n=1 Tax=Paramecium tetraurelia TaxID=5888 RepID=A0E7D6_PARTE|nr:uncharacterized protein GSPATT00023931001 [Paramecium tetraurelia]CAK91203.1 unnamed protein product [Paramecium tetraurelia]|eukprot:XP_001458600.1 hypothetical protein (macronuclear) [Paramecium tetraurelia strain d4-2]